MKKIIRLTESDLTRIIKKIISENESGKIVTNFDKDFDYKSDNDRFYFKAKPTNPNFEKYKNWVEAKGRALEAIKTKVFGNIKTPEVRDSLKVEDPRLKDNQAIIKALKQLKTNWGVEITKANIDKEFEQEGNYRPDNGGVNPEAKKNMLKLISDVRKKFPKLKNTRGIISDYRSYSDQVANFGRKASANGLNKTQSANALPGFSQHHTGNAFDIISLSPSWWELNKDVKDWVANNAKNYGFDVTYKTKGPLRIAEPWHLYYIG